MFVEQLSVKPGETATGILVQLTEICVGMVVTGTGDFVSSTLIVCTWVIVRLQSSVAVQVRFRI